MIIGLIVTGWFVFGFFATRMYLIETMSDDKYATETWEAALFFFGGVLGWFIAMPACEHYRSRRKAHFIPKFPNALKFNPSVNLLAKMFLVKPVKLTVDD